VEAKGKNMSLCWERHNVSAGDAHLREMIAFSREGGTNEHPISQFGLGAVALSHGEVRNVLY
jgi:hypothetical protein